MKQNETKLSNYIDKLNYEKKPVEHNKATDSLEYEELMDTVRLVRSLKEPDFPDSEYPKRLAANLNQNTYQKNKIKKPSRVWFPAMGAIAAVVVIIFIFNIIIPSGGPNIAHAMDIAFQQVKAYHGIIEIVETNALGDEITQATREVWADSKGNYYVEELEGTGKGLITVNNGQKKWQIRPEEKNVYLFPAFPDSYRFTFELGKEIENVKNALEVKTIGEESISGRQASILEVTPKGGDVYHLWIDKDTNLPVQRQSSMQNALQYCITYAELNYSDMIPEELTTYNIPEGYKVIDTNPEQVVNNMDEAEDIAGFIPKLMNTIPEEYFLKIISVATETKKIKLYYSSSGNQKTVAILQEKTSEQFVPDSSAIIGIVNNSTAEILSPVETSEGAMINGGSYGGMTDISSIRWQENGFEYTVIGNVSFDELSLFAESLSEGEVLIPMDENETSNKPEIEVPFDLVAEENDQKSVDAGHSPWRLDPAFVTQVFVSLLISPEGIQGDYPIQYEDITIIQNNGDTAIAQVGGEITPASKVYLKRLIRQDSTGTWTVVGYDPVKK